MPGGTFTGEGVKTVVLFFEKGAPTKKNWFYSLNLERNLGKTNPLNENDLADFVALQKTQAVSENSWPVAQAVVELLPRDNLERKALLSMLGTRGDLESRAQRWVEANPFHQREIVKQLNLWGEEEAAPTPSRKRKP